ncbi:MAG: 30S ribosome-binding factor RbfA [Methyloligella sp. ZOD6]
MSRDKAKGPSQRQLKVGELIRHALADILTRGELMDEVVERHTITVPEVKMSPDLKLATAYVMPLGGGEVKEVVDHLQHHAKYFRGEIAKRVTLKFMPEIRFRQDTSFETSRRIDEILASPEVSRDLDE